MDLCQVFDQELEALQIETVQKETIRESLASSVRASWWKLTRSRPSQTQGSLTR